MMDGKIDWAALPVIVELFGITDVPLFIAELEAVRDHVRFVREVESGKRT